MLRQGWSLRERSGEVWEDLSSPPCRASGQEPESADLAEWHEHKAKSCSGFSIWSVGTGRQGRRPPVCASTTLLPSGLRGLASSQASHSFREGYLPLPQRHLSALANLVPSFPTSKNAWKRAVCSFPTSSPTRSPSDCSDLNGGTALEPSPAAQKPWAKLQLPDCTPADISL